MHSASLCESSHVILIITPSQVKGLGPTVSQKEVELKTKLTYTPAPQFRTEKPVSSGHWSCWSLNSVFSAPLPFS